MRDSRSKRAHCSASGETPWVPFRTRYEKDWNMPSKYPQSFRDRAMRMVVDRMEADEGLTQYQAIKEIAPKLNISTESPRRWIEQSQIDAGAEPGLSSDAQAEIRRHKRENAELRRANEILKSASAFFAAELDRPSTR